MATDPASTPGAQPWPLRSHGEDVASTTKPDIVAASAPRPAAKVETPTIPVTAKPGGLAFTLGSGRGQFLLLLLAGAVVLLAVFVSVDVAIHGLAGVMTIAAVMRLIVPAIKIPALVNRGRGFDVTIFVLCAVVLEVLLLSGIEL